MARIHGSKRRIYENEGKIVIVTVPHVLLDILSEILVTITNISTHGKPEHVMAS